MTQAQGIANLIGTSVGPYRLEAWVGRTETGDLFRAAAEGGRPRLLKLVHAELCDAPGFRPALRQQAMFVAALDHPHIARIEQIGEAGERSYLAIEWLPDGTLRGLLGRRGSLADDLPLALDLARQIAQALAFAHAQGFVHGSLSPDDMLLEHHGDSSYTLKVSDFGLAWLLLDLEVPTEPWADSLVYAMAPERCQGLEVDGRSDQYALGVILYELVTGCAPFAARTPAAAVASHLHAAPVPPQSLNPALPQALEAIILRCLAKAPADRFPDAEALVEAIAAAQAALPPAPALAPAAAEAPPAPPPPLALADIPAPPADAPPEQVGASVSVVDALPAEASGPADTGDAISQPDPHPLSLSGRGEAAHDILKPAPPSPLEGEGGRGGEVGNEAPSAADTPPDAAPPAPALPAIAAASVAAAAAAATLAEAAPPPPAGEQVIFAAPSRSWAPPLAEAPPPAALPPSPPAPLEPGAGSGGEAHPPAAPPEPVAPPAEPIPPGAETGLEALLRTPARQFEPPDLIGQPVAGYLLESFLGPTETGPVYQARRPGAEGPRALKLIAPHLAQDPAFRRRFHERSETIRALRHPHLAEVEAIGEDAGLCYVAMEWLPDGTLRNLMQRRGSAAWSLPLALDLARQTAEALAFIHRRGLIHGSIKPNNLLLARRSGDQTGYTLKLADVGLAALLLEQEGALDEVWADSLVYAMAPERCQGLEVDGRSDQYALGVILYELATGSVPFEARTLDAAVFRHVYTAPVPPRALVPELPATLEAIILRCLAKAPADRFVDAEALAEALNDLLRSPAMAPRMTYVQQPPRANGNRPDGPVQPRVQALDQYGRVLATRDLTGDGLTVGRDPGNALVLDAEAVEPRHLELDWDGGALIVTSLAQTAVVMVGDATLRPHETRVWQWDEPMRLGPFWLRAEAVRQLDAAPAPRPDAFAPAPRPDAFAPPPPPAGHAPVVVSLPGAAPAGGGATAANPTTPITLPADPALALAQPEPAGPAELLTDRVGIILDQESLTLTPGRPAIFRLTLVNLGAIVDHFKLTAEGVPEHWVVGQPPQVQLNPGTQELVTLNLLVPQVPESRAQDYPVTIRARSRENPRESNTAPALWTVLPFTSSSFDLRPKKRTRLFRGAYRVQLRNQGNAPATYNLSASDEEEALSFLFSDERLTLEPGAARRTDLVVRPNRTLWFGQPVQHRFAVQAKPNTQGELHTGGAQLAQLVVFPRWLLLLLLLLLLLGLLGAWLWYRPRVTDLSTDPEVPVAGEPFIVSWAVTNGPTVELLANQTAVAITPGQSSQIIPGFEQPPELRLVARNQVLGRDDRSTVVNLIPPSPIPPPPPTIRPTDPPPSPTIPPPTATMPSATPTATVPSATPTITPTPTSQALCVVGTSLTLAGSGPPNTSVVAFLDARPVGGGRTDAAGRYTIVLGRFFERPGLYPISVRVRDSGEVLRQLTCIVPTPIPLYTSTPTATPTP